LRAGPGATPQVMSKAKSNGKSKCKMLSKTNRTTIQKFVWTTNSKMVGMMARKMFLTMLWSLKWKMLQKMVRTIKRTMVGKSFLKSLLKSCLMTPLNSLLTMAPLVTSEPTQNRVVTLSERSVLRPTQFVPKGLSARGLAVFDSGGILRLRRGRLRSE